MSLIHPRGWMRMWRPKRGGSKRVSASSSGSSFPGKIWERKQRTLRRADRDGSLFITLSNRSSRKMVEMRNNVGFKAHRRALFSLKGDILSSKSTQSLWVWDGWDEANAQICRPSCSDDVEFVTSSQLCASPPMEARFHRLAMSARASLTRYVALTC